MLIRRSYLPILVLIVGCLTSDWLAMGADHLDAHRTDYDYAPDIADVFIFPSPEVGGRMVGAITFGGGPAPRTRVDSGFNCDPNVLYVFNIARDQGNDTFRYDSPDLRVFIRFGTNAAQTECGVQFDNVPGAGNNVSGAKNSISGPIEQVIVSPTGLRAFAGYRNDPFFFDFEAFSTMVGNGFDSGFSKTLGADRGLASAFRLSDLLNRHDSFAGRNVSAVVFEMDTKVLNGNGVRPKIRVWATTGRKPA